MPARIIRCRPRCPCNSTTRTCPCLRTRLGSGSATATRRRPDSRATIRKSAGNRSRGSNRHPAQRPVVQPSIAPKKSPSRLRTCVVCGSLFTASHNSRAYLWSVVRWEIKNAGVARGSHPACASPAVFGRYTGFGECTPCRLDHGSVGALLQEDWRAEQQAHSEHLSACVGSPARALLAGLLDTDGTVSPTGSVQISLTDAQLARDVHELVVSLGYRCGFTTSECGAAPKSRRRPTRRHSRRSTTRSGLNASGSP